MFLLVLQSPAMIIFECANAMFGSIAAMYVGCNQLEIHLLGSHKVLEGIVCPALDSFVHSMLDSFVCLMLALFVCLTLLLLIDA